MPRKDCDSLFIRRGTLKRGCALVGFALWVTVPGVSEASGAAVRMWPDCVVDDDEVRVEHVAQILSVVPDQGQVYSSVVIRPAPEPGQEVEVTLDELRGALVRAGANSAEFTMCGAVRCRIVRALRLRPVLQVQPDPSPSKWWWPASSSSGTATRTGAPDEGMGNADEISVAASQPAVKGTLEQVITDQISTRLRKYGGRPHLRFSPNVKSMLSLARPEYDFRIHLRSEERLGPCSLEVDILQGGKITQTVPMVVEVSLSVPVLMASRPINRGAVIRSTDVELHESDFFHLDRIGLTETGMVVGQQARRFVRAGEILYLKDVRNCPLVKTGDVVTVWSEVGGLKIKTAGKAMEAGSYGDSIAVKNESSNQTFQAVVMGAQSVKMSTGNRPVTVAGITEKESR